MGFYFLILFISLISFFPIHYTKNKRVKKLFFFIGPISILLFVSGLREKVGRDYSSYEFFFNNYNLLDGLEKGYYYLNRIVYELNLSFSVVIFMSSLLTILLIFIIVSKFSKNWFLSFFLFFTNFQLFFQSFTAIRQYIAIAFFFYSIKYIIKRNLKKFLLCVFIGFLFHKSILFIIPFYFLLNINFKKWQIVSLILVSFVLQKLDFIGYFIYQVNEYLPGRYGRYLTSSLNEKMNFGTGLSFFFDLFLFLTIVLLINNKDRRFFDKCCEI
ncbi:EpsG family protein [Halanaerobium salsuginis]|uniref:EpsG family protein n=1 Tax=Halanaerobium salsuginis TaxID=29563 RepID=A0A1I4HJL8_9FIRM|nr:EpsG family protein [Halanaerobium salsuginis]SFL42429.1 EpsG family protein [Halanaerobium salsuginis]